MVENSPQEEPLDPCSECGQLLPASEMIPLDRVQGRLWQAPCGSGLICQECHQAHKEIQSELKALKETPAEPGPQPAAHCAFCGGEFPLAGDPSLSCKSCEYRLRQGSEMAAELKAQERISLPRQNTLPEPQANHDPTTDSPPEIPEASRACPGPGGTPFHGAGTQGLSL